MNDNLEYFEKIDKAIEYFNNASDKELFGFLANDDEVLQQIALLKLDNISSIEEAEKITFTLTEHSSETREYCSFLINRLMKKASCREYFTGDLILEKFVKSVSDVNPKVCRKIIEILPFYMELSKLYPRILKNSFDLVDELREKNKDKNYQYNTKSFHLYWHIFTLGYTLNTNFYEMYKNDLIKLLELLFEFREYTIREKGAFLIKKLTQFLTAEELEVLNKKYSNDENFYVQEIFN